MIQYLSINDNEETQHKGIYKSENMHYSKYFLAALPLVAAAPMPDYDVVYTTIFETVTGPAPTAQAAAAQNTQGGHGHQHVHVSQGGDSSDVAATSAPVATPDAPVVDTVSNSPSVTSSSASSGSTGSSGSSGSCPADTSGQYTSPGVNGNPDLSMLDSINKIRQMYNPSATCLSWSDTLAEASVACANAGTEDNLRANSQIVSDTGYGDAYFDGDLAVTEFERSVFVLLCQSPDDTQLKGQCKGKVGETGCTSGSCTGHHDAVVDAAGEHKFMGAAANGVMKWMALSFAATDGIFS